MLPDKVQSTVFVVDIVEIQSGEDPGPVNNGTHRLRVREIVTVLDTGCLTGKGPTCGVDSRTETELEYEVIRDSPPATITISDHAIKFNNAGLKIRSKATGLEEREGDCSLVPNMVAQLLRTVFPVMNEVADAGQEERNNRLLEEPLGPNTVMALWHCLSQEFGEDFPESLQGGGASTLVAPNTRIFDFHVHARFDSTGGIQINDATDLPGSALALVAPSASLLATDPDPDMLGAGRLQPLIWYPFANQEAFAFGAITTLSSMRLFGRLGAKTDGYRITGRSHWTFDDDETRILTFREDLDPQSFADPNKKHAEFDAGALFPGDVDTKLITDPIGLQLSPVPIFIGAMPMDEPANLSVVRTADGNLFLESMGTNPVRFSFLNGELDVPIVFDPITNCGGCG